MNSNYLRPQTLPAAPRMRQARAAQKTQQAIEERAKLRSINVPPYEFIELVGKGSYGRVYKCRNRNNQQICAVKILETDVADYNDSRNYFDREDSLHAFMKEAKALQALKDARVENVNLFHEALDFDSQLWLVTEYCTGGSLSTLMKAGERKGLDERFIIPIAREVTIALKGIHSVDLIHRDLKCANILVAEDGKVQLCDFGVTGMLESQVSKRSTIIGTPHWMAPELVGFLGFPDMKVAHSSEVDIWGFGCAVFEMATGYPPNARVAPDMLGTRLNEVQPRLEGNEFSPDLKDFIAQCLQTDVQLRPSAADLLNHPYIKNTEESYPTSSIVELVEKYFIWERSGGQRHSLFNAHGAQDPNDNLLSPHSADTEQADEWNFSITPEFDRRLSMRIDPNGDSGFPGQGPSSMDPITRIVTEGQIHRGGAGLERLFNLSRAPYGRGQPLSDLPFRNNFGAENAGDRVSFINLDDANVDSGTATGMNFDLDVVRSKRRTRINDDDDEEATLHAPRRTTQFNLSLDPPEEDNPNFNRRTQDWKFPAWPVAAGDGEQTAKRVTNNFARNRKTQDWKFPSADEWTTASDSEDSDAGRNSIMERFENAPPRPGLQHAATMPVDFGERDNNRSYSPDRGSTIDLDLAWELPSSSITRPSTSASSTTLSALSESSEGADPFDLAEQLQLTMSRTNNIDNNRVSIHMKSQSEPTAGFLGGGTGPGGTLRMGPLLRERIEGGGGGGPGGFRSSHYKGKSSTSSAASFLPPRQQLPTVHMAPHVAAPQPNLVLSTNAELQEQLRRLGEEVPRKIDRAREMWREVCRVYGVDLGGD